METNSPNNWADTVIIRRNPHRKARLTPAAVPISSSSSHVQDIPSFPIEDIHAMEARVNAQQGLCEPASSSSAAASSPVEASKDAENLKVFLRIRPLPPLLASRKHVLDESQTGRTRTKNAWPQRHATKKNTSTLRKNITENCITVNDTQSVILQPPSTLKDQKRMKSEVYEGFAHVFNAGSTQDEVYERMMSPLVEDFLKGKNGMLAALGPTGSGKTHTVFGSGRHPGMVPLALRRIYNDGDPSKSPRSFYISMFEISSERGKGERALDLTPDGGDLCIQQSTLLKGLQKVLISDAAQAESLIARGMLKRATAMTNANSQSSRSQCIINIHHAPDMNNGELGVQANNAVLAIVDLAGAEREKKTGNQGSRLFESNFINNTSMVFGLCLRSMLEHQKNPKKPMQKHFQNSLLTRYLRDYLEGKKRMSLILTVKSGEGDYLDTSFLLRQASPYMHIRFNNVEEKPDLLCNKRHFQKLPRVNQSKRLKSSGLDAFAAQQEKTAGDEHQLDGKDPLKELNDSASLMVDAIDVEKKERNNQILQCFTKALWNVLKEYKEKLEVAENEIQYINESLRSEKARTLELEKELKDFKSCCSCRKEVPSEASAGKLESTSESRVNDSPLLEMEGLSVVDPSCVCTTDIELQNIKVNADVSRISLERPVCIDNEQKYDTDDGNSMVINSLCIGYEIFKKDSQSVMGSASAMAEYTNQKHESPPPGTDVTESASESNSGFMVRHDSISAVEGNHLHSEELEDPGNEVQDLIGSTINEKRHVQQEQENISKSRLNKSSDLKECRSANACETNWEVQFPSLEASECKSTSRKYDYASEKTENSMAGESSFLYKDDTEQRNSLMENSKEMESSYICKDDMEHRNSLTNLEVHFSMHEASECKSTPRKCESASEKVPGNEQGLIGSTINDKRHVQQEEEIILESRLNKSPDLKACRCANVLETNSKVQFSSLEASECKSTPRKCDYALEKMENSMDMKSSHLCGDDMEHRNSQGNLEGRYINLGETWCICTGKDSEMLNSSCSGGENLELQPNQKHKSPHLLHIAAEGLNEMMADGPFPRAAKDDKYSSTMENQLDSEELKVLEADVQGPGESPRTEETGDFDLEIEPKDLICCLSFSAEPSAEAFVTKAGFQARAGVPPEMEKCGSMSINECTIQKEESTSINVDVEDTYPSSDVTGLVSSSMVSSKPIVMVKDDNCSSQVEDQLHCEENKRKLPKEDVASSQGCNIGNVPETEPKGRKPLKENKPKRRLLPASSILLKDLNGSGLEDESEKLKGSRNEKMLPEEAKKTQGSISLLRLLRSNLHRR